jgi:hypothetical protein
MSLRCGFVFVALLVVAGLSAERGWAQQANISTPFHTLNDSFYERIGFNFGFSIAGPNPATLQPGQSAVVGLLPNGQLSPNGNLMFQQGGFNSALPPFGGHDPATDGQFGFARLGPKFDLFLNFAGGQGSNRSMISQVPNVTVTNGFPGTFSDTSQVPFVTGIIPVVGAFTMPPASFGPTQPYYTSPLREKIREYQQRMNQSDPVEAAKQIARDGLAKQQEEPPLAVGSSGSATRSSANHGDVSVADIQRQQSAEEDAKQVEVLALIERARGVEEAGKPNVAKIYYRQAASRATGNLKQQLLDKIANLPD